MSLNRVELIGNLTRDPETKQIPGGQIVATFSVATNLMWTDSSGQRQNKAEYHNIVAWRKLAEICGQYLKKGSKVFIEGRLQTRDWQAEDGSKRYRTEIVADNMIMLDRRADAGDFGDRSAGGIGARNGSSVGGDMGKDMGSDLGSSGDSADALMVDEEVKIDDLPF
ncbi:single-stranded DNA-binding protein [Candidatus Peregrinibacteria bacterium]|nr:single-stranded DNA-binding protein [Candidatus Peregrinibacteria bacterium]